MADAMFKSYEEAMAWVAEGQAKYGKMAFTSRPEYHAAYAEIAELGKAAGAKRVKRKKVYGWGIARFA